MCYSQPKIDVQPQIVIDIKRAVDKASHEIDLVESKIIENFRQNDLQVLQRAFVGESMAARMHFADNPFWKLFWSGEYFASDLQNKLPKQDYIQAEYQMAYSSGKITGYVANLGPVLNETLSPVKDIIPVLQDLSVTEKQIATDPFFLRNQLVSGKNIDYLELNSRITKLVRNQLVIQGASATFWLLTIHFGVPIVFSIPLGIFSGTMSMIYMKLRYSAIERSFLDKLSESQKSLKSKLDSTHTSAVSAATRPFRLRFSKV